MELQFNDLPKAVFDLHQKIDSLTSLFLDKRYSTCSEEDSLLTIKEASELINLSVTTIYGLVSHSEIPVCKKGKRLYFSKQELMAWIKTGRKKTVSEITSEAKGFLKTKKV